MARTARHTPPGSATDGSSASWGPAAREELIQRRLLLRRHPEGKDHALHRQRKLDGASVEFGPGERVNVTAQDDSVAVVYRLRQTGRKPGVAVATAKPTMRTTTKVIR